MRRRLEAVWKQSRRTSVHESGKRAGYLQSPEDALKAPDVTRLAATVTCSDAEAQRQPQQAIHRYLL